jgi:hypothetical protein
LQAGRTARQCLIKMMPNDRVATLALAAMVVSLAVGRWHSQQREDGGGVASYTPGLVAVLALGWVSGNQSMA